MSKKWWLLMLAIAAGTGVGKGQLAITEIMSSASTNLGAAVVVQNSDFWELTNFGNDPVDLTGYRWNDNAGGVIGGDPAPFNGLIIQPGESIVFFECATCVATTNVEPFRTWWALSPSVRCFPYSNNGLSSAGDSVILWAPGATTDGDFVDRIDFLEAVRGQSFVYNPTTGIFEAALVSTNGVGGAFKAVTSDDVGSPGTTTGPLPLAITQQPTNAAVNPGDTAVFSVVASGLPRPKYQWQFNGADIPGARSRTVSITNALTADVGEYRVIVSNGGDPITSSSAALTLNAEPEPPSVLTAPLDRRVFIGQSATFTAVASGVPQPTYQWRKDGVNIGGATANAYTISGAQLGDAAVYSVVIRNALGSLTNEAGLTVTRRPRLVVTEIMPAQSTNGIFRGHNDWWELSNLDDFPVNLKGYRFDDGSITLAAAITFTNQQLTIAPGESIVFVEGMSANAFRSWWGAANLRNVQIVSYAGAGLSLSSLGDVVMLWNSGAADDTDFIATEVFAAATNGVSFGFDPHTETFGDLSEVGVNGAFIAPENGDIGSPGFIRNIPEPRILKILPVPFGYSVSWIGDTGRSYTLQYTTDLNSGSWNTVTTTPPAAGPILSATDLTVGDDQQRFYRVRLEP
jgi:hypothetical protein